MSSVNLPIFIKILTMITFLWRQSWQALTIKMAAVSKKKLFFRTLMIKFEAKITIAEKSGATLGSRVYQTYYICAQSCLSPQGLVLTPYYWNCQKIPFLSTLKSTSVKKETNRTPFFASKAILEMKFSIRSGCILLSQ